MGGPLRLESKAREIKMIGFEKRKGATRVVAVAGAVAVLALAGCNRNEPPQPRSDVPPTNTAPGSMGTAPDGTGMAPGGAGTEPGSVGTATGGAVIQDAPGMAGGSVATAVGDSAVTAKVKAALLADPMVKGLAIEVETRDGVVSLAGKVSGGAERSKALDIARNVEGVRSVTDNLSAMN